MIGLVDPNSGFTCGPPQAMIISRETLDGFRQQVEGEWRDNIAPFWLLYAPDKKYGGFRGWWISNELQVEAHAETSQHCVKTRIFTSMRVERG